MKSKMSYEKWRELVDGDGFSGMYADCIIQSAKDNRIHVLLLGMNDIENAVKLLLKSVPYKEREFCVFNGEDECMWIRDMDKMFTGILRLHSDWQPPEEPKPLPQLVGWDYLNMLCVCSVVHFRSFTIVVGKNVYVIVSHDGCVTIDSRENPTLICMDEGDMVSADNSEIIWPRGMVPPETDEEI